ncbi:MAG: CDP-glucose 4,6-dehydratase [Eubacterium sp.]|nr:CDP-glucose 4,6-dehydratase [Eubacterium sp.]
MELSFFKGKTVFITGHTGFKGSWMCQVLMMAGADVVGYALEPPTNPSLFRLCGLQEKMTSIYGDVRDLSHLKQAFEDTRPEIVIHMAAQPLVRESYINPVYTYETNVLGTVNVLECVRLSSSVKSFVNVTTDKVYLNKEWEWGYRENDELNGFDPYSNSKSCAELATSSYINSFLKEKGTAVSTVRAGNVIGGGDFAKDRIIPDCVRAAEAGKEMIVRNPYSVRPYEHVLEPVAAYLMIAQKQYEDQKYSGNYNIGPEESDCRSTGEIVDLFCRLWKERTGKDMTWKNLHDGGPHEANFLKLDCSKIKIMFQWHPRWTIEDAVKKTIEWASVYLDGGDVAQCARQQIKEYFGSGTF